jgi:hypothetical protein
VTPAKQSCVCARSKRTCWISCGWRPVRRS